MRHSRPLIITATLALITSALNAQSCDPIESAKLLADDGNRKDRFGDAVAISDNTAAIGAFWHGEPTYYAGAVYIYNYRNSQWVKTIELHPSDSARGDRFGSALAMSHDKLIVTAEYHEHHGDSSGAVYIFRNQGDQWIQETEIVAENPTDWEYFGEHVDISGDLAILSTKDDNSGYAYIYRFNGTDWIQETKLIPPDSQHAWTFGYAVAIHQDIAIVASPGSFGSQSTGVAWLYRYNGSEWEVESLLSPDDQTPRNMFGYAVAVSDDVAIIGAFGDNELGEDVGAAYIFRAHENQWIQEARVLASDPEEGAWFGYSVAIEGNKAVVGEIRNDGSGSWAGAAYLFLNDGTNWDEGTKIISDKVGEDDDFGCAVALSDQNALIGASGDHTNGDDAGAAYIFDLNCNCLNLVVSNLIAGQKASFNVTRGTPGAKAITVFGTQPGKTTIENYGNYCATFGIKNINPNRVIGPINHRFDTNGLIRFKIEIPPHLAGQQLYFQSAQQNTCPQQCTSNLIQKTIQ